MLQYESMSTDDVIQNKMNWKYSNRTPFKKVNKPLILKWNVLLCTSWKEWLNLFLEFNSQVVQLRNWPAKKPTYQKTNFEFFQTACYFAISMHVHANQSLTYAIYWHSRKHNISSRIFSIEDSLKRERTQLFTGKVIE